MFYICCYKYVKLNMEKLVKIKYNTDFIKVKLFYCPVKPDNPHKLSDGTPIGLWEDANKTIYHTNDFIEIKDV